MAETNANEIMSIVPRKEEIEQMTSSVKKSERAWMQATKNVEGVRAV